MIKLNRGRKLNRSRKFDESTDYSKYYSDSLALERIRKSVKYAEDILEHVSNLREVIKIFAETGEMGSNADDSTFEDFGSFALEANIEIRETINLINELSDKLEDIRDSITI